MTLEPLHGPTIRMWAALIPLLIGCSDSTAPVTSSVSTGQFTITVRFVDPAPPSSSVLTAFNHATARWESVIVDSVGSIPIKLAAGACDSAHPAVNETVKDLLVLVHLRQILDTVPGQAILGESGPCLIRNPGNLPILGVMSLNSSTLATLASSGLLDDVIKHEMAHLLGFGTVWDLDGLLRDTTTSDPWFSGPDAQAAFRMALPGFTDKIVPVPTNPDLHAQLNEPSRFVQVAFVSQGWFEHSLTSVHVTPLPV